LPLFGNTFSINPTKLHMTLYDWAEKYGDIMRISLFNTPIVVVNSTEMAYEVLGRTGNVYLNNINTHTFLTVIVLILASNEGLCSQRN